MVKTKPVCENFNVAVMDDDDYYACLKITHDGYQWEVITLDSSQEILQVIAALEAYVHGPHGICGFCGGAMVGKRENLSHPRHMREEKK